MRVVMWLTVRPSENELVMETYRVEMSVDLTAAVVPQVGDEVYLAGGVTLPVARRVVGPDHVDVILSTVALRPKFDERPLSPTLVGSLVADGWLRHERS